MPSLPLSTSLIITLLFLVYSSFSAAAGANTTSLRSLSRSDFPPGFLFGTASAAYQYEGAAFEDGKGPSIWDTFAHIPGKILDKSNGDVANDFYHLYKDDVKSLKYLGVDTFRMSISWPRILPGGKLSAGVNKKGITFYNNVINELLANGISPFVTLFHWDLPQALEDEYEGFLSPRIIGDYKDFAELCFKEFGDRVKHWITFNEPFTFANGGYDGDFIGSFAPGRCTDRAKCVKGNSGTEPYIATHNMLISHAETVALYRKKYKGDQKGEIGITLVAEWMLPYSNSTQDAEASQRALDYTYGWFMDPIVYGDYPKSMRSFVANRLPKFTKEQQALLKGSIDFLGLNYYTSFYASHQLASSKNMSYTTDRRALLSSFRNGVPIGEATGAGLFYIYPVGFYKLLVYTKEKYKNPTIYITENGISDLKNASIKHNINDPQRISFYIRHLQAIRQAIGKGVKVKGFFGWTFQDCYEWGSGYTQLFGFYYIDREHGVKRIPKKSAFWFKKFLAK